MDIKSAINQGLVSITQIAGYCGVSERTVYNWLSGKKVPSVKKANKLEKETQGIIKAADWG